MQKSSHVHEFIEYVFNYCSFSLISFPSDVSPLLCTPIFLILRVNSLVLMSEKILIPNMARALPSFFVKLKHPMSLAACAPSVKRGNDKTCFHNIAWFDKHFRSALESPFWSSNLECRDPQTASAARQSATYNHCYPATIQWVTLISQRQIRR